MIRPHSHFAEAFREYVLPDLLVAADHCAWLMEIGEETFCESFSFVMRSAIDRGAAYLPDEHFTMMADWIGATLLHAIDGHARRMAPARALADRVYQDVLEWEAAVITMLDATVVV